MERTASVRRIGRVWRLCRAPLLLVTGLWAALVTALSVAVYLVPYPAQRFDAALGGPLIITDRRGEVLRTVPNPGGRPGRNQWVPLSDVPAPVVLTVIESEDHNFYSHRGVDGAGILRAAWLNIKSGRAVFGGSTITMQLMRMEHHANEPRSLTNKLTEAVLAMRAERAVDKRTILEHYLNRAYYGNGAYGIDAAAQRYFGKPAVGLSLAEATLLAVIPRAPSAYDPTRNLAATIRRRDYLLGLLERRGLVSAEAAARARNQEIALHLHEPAFLAPHFTDWVLGELPAAVRARGGVVRTTLDLGLQQALEHRTREHVAGMRAEGLTQAGMVVLDSQSGETLAMVGSADYRGQDGQVNITTWRRHPGSALKPFVYALAIESGGNPASIAYDIYDHRADYRVIDKTQPERGPVRYREALAGSYNMAAVDVLAQVGVTRLMSLLRQAGVGSLDSDPKEYGLRLALGSAKVRLLDLAAGYGFLVRKGRVRPPLGILGVTRDDGTTWRPLARADQQVLSPATSFMVMDMLADPDARRKVFGHDLPLDLPYRVAAKTGTARGFADTVAVAVTNELTVAAWAGSFSGRPTEGLVAMESAAPLVRAGLLLASGGRPLTLPKQPDNVEETYICPVSGKRPGPDCPHQMLEYVHRGHAPQETCDWHRHEGDRLVIEYPDAAKEWAQRQLSRHGRNLSLF